MISRSTRLAVGIAFALLGAASLVVADLVSG